MIISVGNLVPNFACGGNLPRCWDHHVARGWLGLPHYCHCRVCGPSCTSGWHESAWPPCLYVNVLHGAWCCYKNFCSYQKKSHSFSDASDMFMDPPVWFHCPLYLSSLWSTIRNSCCLEVHLCWWSGLKHQLALFNTRIWQYFC